MSVSARSHHRRPLAGQQAERYALHYLQAQGLVWIQSNYRSIYGEIDLILQDQQTLVFAEVRYRRNNHFMLAAETVHATKQRKILITARYFLTQHHTTCHTIRFDVITLVGRLDCAPEVTWIQSAFEDID